MEPAPLGLNSRNVVASSALLYALPFVSLILGSRLRYEPVLQLIFLFGMMFGLFSLLIPGVVALILVDGAADITALETKTLNDARAPVVLDCLLHDAFRCLMVYVLMLGECYFRRQGGQVMYASKLRLLPVGAVAGLGFGLLRGLCIVASSASAAMEVDTTTSNAGFVLNAPSSVGIFIDLDACPQMPLLVSQAAGHFLAAVGDIAWTTLLIPWFATSMEADMLADEEKWHAQVQDFKKVEMAYLEKKRELIKNRKKEKQQKKEKAEQQGEEKKEEEQEEAEEEIPEEEKKEDSKMRKTKKNLIINRNWSRNPRLFRMTSAAKLTNSQRLGFLIVSLITHLLFGLSTLANKDAFDWHIVEVVAGKGCIVSLPIQAISVFIAVCFAVYLATLEKFEPPAPSSGDSASVSSPSSLSSAVSSSSSSSAPTPIAGVSDSRNAAQQQHSAQQQQPRAATPVSDGDNTNNSKSLEPAEDENQNPNSSSSAVPYSSPTVPGGDASVPFEL